MRTPEAYSLSKFAELNPVLLTIVVMLYMSCLGLFILENWILWDLVPVDQYLSVAPTSPPLITISLFSTITFLDSTYN